MKKNIILPLKFFIVITIAFSVFFIFSETINNHKINNFNAATAFLATDAMPQSPDEQLAEDLIAKKCTEDQSDNYITDCAVKILDRAVAEREWKQQKLEAAKYTQINASYSAEDNSDWQLLISKWRKNFKEMRDGWCNARWSFRIGSGIPLGIATCRLEIELQAIHDLNFIYYTTIVDFNGGRIVDFEPTSANIDAFVKVNATSVEDPIWCGKTGCK